MTIGAFSKDSERCIKCKHYDDCEEKRMELCAYIVPEEILQPIGEQYVMPNEVSLADCVNMLVDEATVYQQTQNELEKELYKELYCTFRRDIYGKNG